MLPATLCLFLLRAAVGGPHALAQDPASSIISPEEWRADLRQMLHEMESTHADLYHSISKQELTERARSLADRLPRLERHQIVVELARVVAAIGDGHTRLWLYPNAENRFRRYPLFLYRFGDDLRILAIDANQAWAAGGRVLRIGGLDAAAAFDRVAEVVQRDNPMTLESLVPRYLTIPEVLQAVGVIDDMSRAAFVVDDDGEERELSLAPVDDGQLPSLRSRPFLPPLDASRIPLVGAGPAEGQPLYLRHLDRVLWHQHLAEEKALFVQINAIRDPAEQSLAEGFRRAMAAVDELDTERVVLDLRFNRGGNNYLNFPLLHEIIRRERIDRPGHLFVLIGRHTFSAASHLVSALELHTHALFVGEPTGAAPNHFGDAPPIFLEHSGLVVSASSLFWQNTRPFPHEERRSTPPHLSAPPTFAAYRSGRDPALEAALSYKEEASLSQRLLTAFEKDGITALRFTLDSFLAEPQNRFAYVLPEVRRATRALLDREQPAEAVELMKAAVDLYPDSPSAHESLGDALAAAGDRAGAEGAYRRMMEIAPRGLPQARARLRLRDLERR